ncbi:MAG: MFS transporter, partial [Bryobacteraceae bacterium]
MCSCFWSGFLLAGFCCGTSPGLTCSGLVSFSCPRTCCRLLCFRSGFRLPGSCLGTSFFLCCAGGVPSAKAGTVPLSRTAAKPAKAALPINQLDIRLRRRFREGTKPHSIIGMWGEMRRRSVAVLAISHFATDLNQGVLPAMLPLFIVQRHFSYEVAAYLVMAISGASCFLQPVFGWLADRRPSPWLAPAGVLVAGIAMAFVGVASTETWLIVAASVSGLGLAAFHPEG